MTTVKIKSTGAGSLKYGPCEICNKHAGEIYHLYDYTRTPQISKWGHLECLKAYMKRKGYKLSTVKE
jgi:hypothetical protein